MANLKALFSKFSSQMDLLGLFILAAFTLMVHKVEPIQDMVYYDGRIYAAYGKQGIRVLDVSTTPSEPQEVGKYNTLGSAQALTLWPHDDKLYLLVADGKAGIGLYEVGSEGELIHGWSDPSISPAEDIAIQGKFAFVARGKKGLTILKIDDGAPKKNKIWGLENSPAVNHVLVEGERIYLVDRENQLFVLELNKEDPNKSLPSQPYPVGAQVNDLIILGGVARIATQGSGLVYINTYLPPEDSRMGEYSDIKNVQDIFIEGNIAYISAGKDGIQALEIYDPANLIKLGAIEKVQTGMVGPSGAAGSDPEGEPILKNIDAQQIVGGGGYLYFADSISGIRTLEPKHLIDVDLVDILGGINNDESWAEDVVILHNEGKDENDPGKNYAYVAGGDRGLWVFDVSDPHHPEDVSYTISPKVEGGKILSGHINAIAAHGDTIFISYKSKGVQALNVSNPKKLKAYPPLEFEKDDRTWDLATLNGDIIFLAAGEDGLRIVDYSDKLAPRLVSSEGASGKSVGVAITNRFAYLSAGENGLHIFDIENEDIPTLVNTYDSGGDAWALAPYTHKKNKDSDPEHYAYLANGGGGVQVLSLANPREPSQIDDFDTPVEARDVFVQDDKLFVADRDAGLLLYNLKEDPEHPALMGGSDTPGRANGVTIDGDFAFIADQNRGLRIININIEKGEVREIGYFDMPTKVKDLILTPDNRYAYMVGDAAGMWTLDLGNRKNPIPIHRLEIVGEPTSIEWVRDAKGVIHSNRRAVISDGSRGFYLVELVDPKQPALLTHYTGLKDDQKDIHQDVRRVIAVEETAYVSNGDGGMTILSIADLDEIKLRDTFGTHGAAMNIDIAGEYIYIVTAEGKVDIGHISDVSDEKWKVVKQPPDPAMNTLLSNTFGIDVHLSYNFAYVSDGVNGLVVLNVTQPLKPVQVNRWDTPGTLKDVDVQPFYIFMADGENGVAMVYDPFWWIFQPEAKAYYRFDPEEAKSPQGCVPNAQIIKSIPHVIDEKEEDDEIIRTLHHFAYTATDQCGLVTLRYAVSTEFDSFGLYPSPGEASFRMVVRGFGGVLGEMLKSVWRGDISVLDVPFIARNALIGHARALDQRVRDAGQMYLFGAIFLTFGLLFWLGLVGNFVLPVRSLRVGARVFQNLFSYFRGFHGPIVLAREGREITRILESQGIGVVLVDMNSAVVIQEVPVRGPLNLLRRGTFRRRREAGESPLQARVAGPGLVLLNEFERVRMVVDLRRQIRLRADVTTHTRDGIEVRSHVFTGFTLGENPEILKVTYEGLPEADNLREVLLRDTWVSIPGNPDREHQVQVVQALVNSLDPIDRKEIHRYIQTLGVDFDGAIDEPDEGTTGNPFLFDADRVFKAAVSRPYDVEDKETKDWSELPPHVAAGLYRDFISRDMYDHLFKPGDPREYPIAHLKQRFAASMRNQGILAFQYVTNQDGTHIEVDQVWEQDQILTSPTQTFRNPKPLRARGIKIVFAGFTEITSRHEDVRGHLTEYWQSEWQRETGITRSDYDLQAMRVITQARIQAETDLVNTLGTVFQNENFSRQALVYRVLQALEAASTYPEMNSLVPHETVQMLTRIQQMLGTGGEDGGIDDDDLDDGGNGGDPAGGNDGEPNVFIPV